MERATHDFGGKIKVEGKIFQKCILKLDQHALVTATHSWWQYSERKGIHVLNFH